MNYQVTQFNNTTLRYMRTGQDVLLNSKDVCEIMGINATNKKNTGLFGPCCDLVDVLRNEDAENIRFITFIINSFSDCSLENLIRPGGIDEDWIPKNRD